MTWQLPANQRQLSRGAKEWLSPRMAGNHSYVETLGQPAFAKAFELGSSPSNGTLSTNVNERSRGYCATCAMHRHDHSQYTNRNKSLP